MLVSEVSSVKFTRSCFPSHILSVRFLKTLIFFVFFEIVLIVFVLYFPHMTGSHVKSRFLELAHQLIIVKDRIWILMSVTFPIPDIYINCIHFPLNSALKF